MTEPVVAPVRLSDMRRIITLTAAALAVLGVVLAGVLTQRSHVAQSKVVPVHVKLMPVHTSVVPRPVIIPGGPARGLEPAQPIHPSSGWGFR
jgi:hypothetical protein